MTLLDMGGLLPWDLWVAAWPVIKIPLDAGFATPRILLDLRLTLSYPHHALSTIVKYCDFGRYSEKI